MKLLLERDTFTDKSTTGILYQEFDEGDGNFTYNEICYTLEDKCREEFGKPETFVKVKGETAIPYGTYKIVITPSPRFKRDLPRLLNVPHFDGILVHSGNKSSDTEGCLLLGTERSADWISNSKVAFTKFFDLVKKAIDSGEEIWIEITKAEEE